MSSFSICHVLYLSVLCCELIHGLSNLGVYLFFCVFISAYHLIVTMVPDSFLFTLVLS